VKLVKLLVTGAAGFIGSNFVRRSLHVRSEVEIIGLDALTYAGNLSNLASVLGHIEFVEGNILDFDLVDALVSRSDCVVHFAAESHNDNSLRNPHIFLRTNVEGTFNLIQAATKHGKRFHHISTDEVFGDLPLDSKQSFDLESPYLPSSPYSASKAASDHLVRAWVRSFGLNATISISSNNYGPYQHEEKLIPKSILSAAGGMKPRIYGEGLNIRDWLFVDDHIEGIWAVLDKGELGETYLFGGLNEKSSLEVVKLILKLLDLPDDFYEFVEDRPGHDRRYSLSINESKSKLDWSPSKIPMESRIEGMLEHYLRL
jgi:dTDP-glucose 4,6-dehydratase